LTRKAVGVFFVRFQSAASSQIKIVVDAKLHVLKSVILKIQTAISATTTQKNFFQDKYIVIMFPLQRGRRLRVNESIRSLVQYIKSIGFYVSYVYCRRRKRTSRNFPCQEFSPFIDLTVKKRRIIRFRNSWQHLRKVDENLKDNAGTEVEP
jgi:hypothetical protein